MVIKAVNLHNFRSYNRVEFEFDPETTVVIGPNGSGKTNMLEAIYMIATGKSFRAEMEAEVIRYGEGFGRIEAEIRIKPQITSPKSQIKRLEILVSDGSQEFPRKRFLVNGVSRRMIDFVGNLRAVLFGPWDMELLDGSPGKRRRYLDMVLSQVDREYGRSLISYEKGIRQRNKLLESIREGFASRTQLSFWDKLVIRNGNYITDKRAEFIDFLVNRVGQPIELGMEYDKSEISEARLAQYENEEVAAAVTLVGPHRDDFVVAQATNLKSQATKDVAKFGSRGEQRMAVLWLKMGELDFIESKTGERPLLLLDDIFSELDQKHRMVVCGMVGSQQTIITAADEHLVLGVGGKVLRLGVE